MRCANARAGHKGDVVSLGLSMAREHHSIFAKRTIPSQWFRSTERMVAELTGPQREAFVFYLWTEVGKECKEALPHVGPAPDGRGLAKLDVVGRIKSGELEVVVLSMPPATEPNEVMFLALVRGGGRLSVFSYERCLGDAGAGVHPSEAVLAESRADGSRINFGFKEGLDLAAFKQHLGEVLGISLDGLETSLAPVTMDAFVAAGGGPGRRGGASAGASSGAKPRGLLETALLVRWSVPLVVFGLARVMPGLLSGLWSILGYLYLALSAFIGIALLVWLYRVYDARRGATPFSPGMAVAGWFIPLVNAILPPFIVRGAWKAVVGSGGISLSLLWWVCWLIESMMMVLARSPMFAGNLDAMPPALAELIMMAWSPLASLLVTLGAYGILWHIVRTVRARL